MRRPTISSAGSSKEWSYFLTRWKDYAKATQLKGKGIVLQLLECYEEQLQKDHEERRRFAHQQIHGRGDGSSEKTCHERRKHYGHSCTATQLHNMRQDRDEMIRSFCARLRGQASVCKLLIKCPGCNVDINYTENIPYDVVTRGLADSEIN